MKRICLVSTMFATLLSLPQTAAAEPYPSMLYIPREDVTLRPLSINGCSSQANSALGCAGVDEEVTYPPSAEVDTVIDGLTAALAEFDVIVTSERPPEYVPYSMLILRDDPIEDSTSRTCTASRLHCESRKRNDIAFTSGTTMNCTDPIALHAALYAVGRLAGLAATSNPADPMNYPPDYTVDPPVTGFQDACDNRVPLLDEKGMELPFGCAISEHASECDGDEEVNSYAGLLAVYGEKREDTEAPVLSNITPEAGVIAADEPIVMNVTIADDDPTVAVRWTIASEIFGDAGQLSKCATSDLCDQDWGVPFPATDGDWTFAIDPPGNGWPNGDYLITLEVSDYHGNVADLVEVQVTVEGNDDTGADGGSDGGDGGGDDAGDGGVFTTGADGGDDGDDSGGDTTGGVDTSAADDDDGGCSVAPNRSNGAALMLLGLVGFGFMRRRRHAA